MRVQRVALGLTVVNMVLLTALVMERVQPAVAGEAEVQADGVLPALRARSLEIVDEQNRVRALLAVMPPTTVDGKAYPETVLLRMIDPKSGPVVKISAAEDGAGLMLTDDSDRGVLMYARNGSGEVKVQGKAGRETVIKP